jgi:hypothetical protein
MQTVGDARETSSVTDLTSPAHKGQVVDGHHTCDPSNCVRRGLAALGRRVLFLISTYIHYFTVHVYNVNTCVPIFFWHFGCPLR